MKIKNTIYSLQKGYTLLELTVVMVILIIVGTLVVGILSSSFRGTAKSKITNDLAQSGNYALTTITDILLNSQSFQSITDSSASVYASCPSTGIVGKTVTVIGFDGGITSISCNDFGTTPNYTISSNSASLLDTSRVQLIANSCSFRCTQSDVYSPPRIDVLFQLKNASGNSQEAQGNVTFNTSLSLRNQLLK